MTTGNFRQRKAWTRLLLWSVPLVAVVTLGTLQRAAETRAALSEVSGWLLEGDGRAVRKTVEGIAGPQAETARRLADVLEGRGEDLSATVFADFDPTAYPLPLLIRAAFRRGDFPAALALTELARSYGLETPPSVTAATLIEVGRTEEARDVYLDAVPADEPPNGLTRRVERHLCDPEGDGTVKVRDRHGDLIARFGDGGLEVAEGVRPELVPRTVADLVDRSAGSVRLSLDLDLAAAAYDAFGRYYRGSIVLLDARSGEILAAVSDRRTHRQGGTPAFEQFREPASIAKLITTTASLRAGHDPDAELARMRCRGHEKYGGSFLYCPHIAGRLRGLDRALAVSCNVAFANLGKQIGWRELAREHRRFGFGGSLGAFPGGRVLQGWGDPRELADLSIGLEESEMTPLHGALLAAVFANEGRMPTPRLVVSEDGRLGLHPRPLSPAEGRQVIEPEWVPEVLGAMEAVARRGTGRNLAPWSFPVAMKTGTASHPRYGFHVNYVGVGPMPTPWLAFCVRITDRPTSRKVRIAARDVTRRLLRNLARVAGERGWTGGPQSAPPRLASSLPAVHRLSQRPDWVPETVAAR